MATFTRPSVGNTAGNAAISTTTQVSNSQVRDVRRLVEALDYRETPLTSMIGFSNRGVRARKVEWTDKRAPAISDTTNGSYTSGATTLNVSNGGKFQVYNVIKVDAELMLVTAIATNALTVTPGWAGTTQANHASAATVSIIGVAMPENLDAPPSSYTLGDFYSNFVQRWNKRIIIDKRQNRANNYLTVEGGEYRDRLKEQMQQAKWELEQTLFSGVGVDATGALPSAMSGFPQYITSNVTTITGAFTERQFLDALAPAFDDIGMAGLGDTVIVGRFTKQVIGSWADPARRLSGSDTAITARIDRINSDFGELDIMMHKSCPATELYFMNPKNYELVPYDGLDWHDQDIQARGDYMDGFVGADYTLIGLGNRASAKMTGFSTTAADYSTMSA
jgi:hypothetical protein